VARHVPQFLPAERGRGFGTFGENSLKHCSLLLKYRTSSPQAWVLFTKEKKMQKRINKNQSDS